MMNDYLVDVAVEINIWIRPNLQREQFEVIKKARPSVLFLISDGGRNEQEWEAIKIGRNIYDNEINWNCHVYRMYEERNQGLYAMGAKAKKLVWSKVDACIFLEDDIIPAVSYFKFCADMFEKYRDDTRIFGICGFNIEEINKNCSDDYFFSRYGSVWGAAFWKRSYLQCSTVFTKSQYTQDLLKDQMKEHPTHWKQITEIIKTGEYDGHVPAMEFYMNLAVYGYHQLFIVPKYNLVSNKGCDPSSAHSDSIIKLPRAIRKAFNSKTYELTFPLKEPVYVIPDIKYEKQRNRILAIDHPLIDLSRKVERGLLLIKNGDGKTLWTKIGKYIDKTKQIEK